MPVYVQGGGEHLVSWTSNNLRAARQKAGLTLRGLSRRAKVSPAQLSKLETGKATLDLEQLEQLAAVLGVGVSDLLPRTRTRHYLISRRAQVASEPAAARPLSGPVPGPTHHHNPVWPLADAFVGKQLEPVLAEIRPLKDENLHFIGHDHEELMFVLRGSVESILRTEHGVVKERLGPGDCLYFKSYQPHCHRSASRTAATTLHVIHSIHGPIDGDDGELASAGHQLFRRGRHNSVAKEAAEKIALLRRTTGYSLLELARASNTTPRHLRQVEQGTQPVTLPLLVSVARAFRRPIEYFFATSIERGASHFVQRHSATDTTPDGWTTANGDRFRSLADGFGPRGMQAFHVQMSSQASGSRALRDHHGQQFTYVLDGEVELLSHSDDGPIRETLKEGDALFLDTSVPHALVGQSRNPFASKSAELLSVYWSPLGAEYLTTRLRGGEAPRLKTGGDRRARRG